MTEFLLLKYPDKCNIYNSKGEKPLIALASEFGQLRCVNLLLDFNADPTQRLPDSGKNCLDLAIDNGHRYVDHIEVVR